MTVAKLLLVSFLVLCVAVTNSEHRDTFQRFKRWSTSLISRPVEQHECKNDADCSNIPYTSCAVDQLDKKYKCLCADSSQPINGDCKKKPKELRTPCAEDYECQPGAECAQETDESKTKVCTCRDDYVEVNNTCTNGCNFMQAESTTIIVVTLFGVAYSIFRYY